MDHIRVYHELDLEVFRSETVAITYTWIFHVKIIVLFILEFARVQAFPVVKSITDFLSIH